MKCNELDTLIKVNSQYVIHLIARSLDIELPSANVSKSRITMINSFIEIL